MKSIIEKIREQLKEIEEKFSVMPSVVKNSSEKKAKVKVTVDNSDETNSDTYRENSNIFTMFNQQADVGSLKIDVKIDEDVEEDPSDSIYEGGKDTVYGTGSNPKPEDETYLNLLKGTVLPKKIKVSTED